MQNSTNGIAIFFSCEYSPGAMNSHSCHRMNGTASISPASAPIFMDSMKGSSRSVYMNLPPFGSSSLQAAAR